MRILHCCLAAFYIDDCGYQENVLPKIHALQGHEVEIVASTEIYLPNLQLGFRASGAYTTADGLAITRLPYSRFVPSKIANKLRLYSGLRQVLERFRPEVLFLHDCQFLSVRTIAEYARTHSVRVYVDCHTDYCNSARNWLSKYLLHKWIYKHCVRQMIPVTTRFFGTLPLRCSFLRDMYDVPDDKIALLPFGADDTLCNYKAKQAIRNAVRSSLGIGENAVVLVSGGKLDVRKRSDSLLEAFRLLRDQARDKQLFLLLFGKPSIDMKATIEQLLKQEGVIYLEWIAARELYQCFFAADLAVFPGTHSVLWEEAAGWGLPLLVKRWKGMEHLDIGGNCMFLEEGTVSEIVVAIQRLIDDRIAFRRAKDRAEEVRVEYFVYSKIAQKALS